VLTQYRETHAKSSGNMEIEVERIIVITFDGYYNANGCDRICGFYSPERKGFAANKRFANVAW
jgi:hypothetical protein